MSNVSETEKDPEAEPAAAKSEEPEPAVPAREEPASGNGKPAARGAAASAEESPPAEEAKGAEPTAASKAGTTDAASTPKTARTAAASSTNAADGAEAATEPAKAPVGAAGGNEGEQDAATAGKAAATADPAQADQRVSLVKAKDQDPFGSFAPVPEAVPGRARRVAARVGNAVGDFLGHEWTMAAVGSVLLAMVMTWPTLRHPATTIPQDIADPTLQAWQMSWGGHILTTNPAQLWNANAFFPDKYSYAFSDTLLGYAPAGMIGSGPVAALVRYNIIYVLIFALAFFGAYVLARQLGARPTGAVVAGAAFAYAPWRLGQAGHLHVLSIGGIALALAMLARGHGFSLRDGYQPDRRRWGWVLAGWLVAAWQISLGFGIGIPFVYALLLIVVATAVSWGYRHVRKWGSPGRSAGSCSSPTSAAGQSSPQSAG
ncbi:hypothetical protein GCM10027610_120130 [Dactylosporangium cerinum]